jgi:hypothetical protein
MGLAPNPGGQSRGLRSLQTEGAKHRRTSDIDTPCVEAVLDDRARHLAPNPDNQIGRQTNVLELELANLLCRLQIGDQVIANRAPEPSRSGPVQDESPPTMIRDRLVEKSNHAAGDAFQWIREGETARTDQLVEPARQFANDRNGKLLEVR